MRQGNLSRANLFRARETSVPKMEHIGHAPRVPSLEAVRVYSGQLCSARAIEINRPTFIGKMPMVLCCCRYRFFLCVLFGAGVLPVFFFRFAGFLFRGIIDLLIYEQRGIHPLQICDGSSVALALPKFDDAGVTSIAIGRAR